MCNKLAKLAQHIEFPYLPIAFTLVYTEHLRVVYRRHAHFCAKEAAFGVFMDTVPMVS